MPGATGFGATGKPAAAQSATSASRTARVSGQQRGTHRLPGRVDQHDTVHLPREPDRGHLRTLVGRQPRGARTSACHHVSGAISAQPGCGDDSA